MTARSAQAVQCDNIGPAERRKWVSSGIVSSVISIAVFAGLVSSGADHRWRLLLFLPFAAAATGFFQWHHKTCVGLAWRSQRDLDTGPQKITDPVELAQVRAQAKRVTSSPRSQRWSSPGFARAGDHPVVNVHQGGGIGPLVFA